MSEWLNTVIQDGGEWCGNCETAWRILKADDAGSKRVIEECYGCGDEEFDIYEAEADGP